MLYFNHIEKKCKEDSRRTAKIKTTLHTQKKRSKPQLLNTKFEDLGKLEGQVGVYEEKIEKLKQDKINIKRHPENYGVEVDSRASVKFWIGLSLIIPLTLYIFIFYISTSFSGFFRTFDPSTDLFGGMFYPKALNRSLGGRNPGIRFYSFYTICIFWPGISYPYVSTKKWIYELFQNWNAIHSYVSF